MTCPRFSYPQSHKGGDEAIKTVNVGYMVRAPTGSRTLSQLNTAAQQLRSAGTQAAEHGRLFSYPKTKSNNFDSRKSGRKRGHLMDFFNSAVDVLQTLVIALGAGLGIWGVINLLEGYGNDNRATRS